MEKRSTVKYLHVGEKAFCDAECILPSDAADIAYLVTLYLHCSTDCVVSMDTELSGNVNLPVRKLR